MNNKKLRKERREKINQAKSILLKAEAENRDLTANEQKEFDDLYRRITQIDVELWENETRSDFEPWEDEVEVPDILRRMPDSIISSQPFSSHVDAENTFMIEAKDGQMVRGFRNGASLHDHCRYNLPDGMRVDELSFGRWLRGCFTGDWRGADAEKRLSGSDGPGGGFLVPEPMSNMIIDLARNKARVMEAGAGTIPMTSSTLTVASIQSDPVPYWVGENAEGTFSDDGTLGAFTLTTRKLMCLVRASRELLEDVPDAGRIVQDMVSNAMALEIDRVGLYGDGTGIEPLGLKNWPGIQQTSLGANGLALTYDDVSNAWQDIIEQNAPEEGMAFIIAPRTRGQLERLKDGQGNPLSPPESWGKIRKLTTNQVRTDLTQGTSDDASDGFLGHFSELYYGIRSPLSFEFAREAGSTSSSAFIRDQVWIKARMRLDVFVFRPTWFVNIQGIIPA